MDAVASLNHKVSQANHELVLAVVERATGYRPTGVEAIVGRGMSSDVLVAQTRDGRFVVRTRDSDWLPQFKKEAWCLKEAHARGVPVPLAIDCGRENGRAYSLARFVEGGKTIDASVDRLKVWEKLGCYARALNEIPVSGFGPEMTANGCFSKSTWKEMIQPEIDIVFRDDIWERRGILTAEQVKRVKELVSECLSLNGKPGVCQWDMCCENALIRNNNVNDIVLLDLDQITSVLIPHYQVAYVAKGWGLESGIMTAFLRGYGMGDSAFESAVPIVKRNLVLQSMRSVRWAEDRNPNWLELNLETARKEVTKHLGRELNLRG